MNLLDIGVVKLTKGSRGIKSSMEDSKRKPKINTTLPVPIPRIPIIKMGNRPTISTPKLPTLPTVSPPKSIRATTIVDAKLNPKVCFCVDAKKNDANRNRAEAKYATAMARLSELITRIMACDTKKTNMVMFIRLSITSLTSFSLSVKSPLKQQNLRIWLASFMALNI
jgi:hypothetical protein